MARTKQKAERSPLTKERVLRAAIAVADRDGVDALTMRNLGSALGVEAMSLYNHVANKREILDGMVDLVMGELDLPDVAWKEALRHRSLRFHELLLRHPWASKVIESSVDLGPRRLQHYDAVLGVLRRAGFTVALAYEASLTLDSYIYGFVLQELAWPYEAEERAEVVAPMAEQVSADALPYVVEMMHYVSRGPGARKPKGYASEFAFGLELILEGLERTRDKQRRSGRR